MSNNELNYLCYHINITNTSKQSNKEYIYKHHSHDSRRGHITICASSIIDLSTKPHNRGCPINIRRQTDIAWMFILPRHSIYTLFSVGCLLSCVAGNT